MKDKKGSTKGYFSAILGGFVILLGLIWFFIVLARKEYNLMIPAVLFLIIGVSTLGISILYISRRN